MTLVTPSHPHVAQGSGLSQARFDCFAEDKGSWHICSETANAGDEEYRENLAQWCPAVIRAKAPTFSLPTTLTPSVQIQHGGGK